MVSRLGRSPKSGKLSSCFLIIKLSDFVTKVQIGSGIYTRGGQVLLVIPCLFVISFFSSDVHFRIDDSLALLTGGHFHDSGR